MVATADIVVEVKLTAGPTFESMKVLRVEQNNSREEVLQIFSKTQIDHFSVAEYKEDSTL